MFVDQFEPDGTSYVYRKSSKGAAIRVSAEERDAFIADFNRNLGRLYWGLLVGTVVFVLPLTIWVAMQDGELSQWSIYAGLGVVLALYMLGWQQAWNAPARKLATRSTVAPERSRDEFAA
ncbi:MAG: hypothetical protein JWP28_3799 [Phenylobacterium sp.]|uniref:hypothetical protein n=1 Tax=Phenylobacterium sp. TaxID=1871053 RepID=UPI0026293102|nr:hypothetical protein [Phenylobacterium sp.]MDB5499768.1 hypothetical protein [Phenylobacterium sp.]